jgi:cbb3-type cytochrome oxidase subunit 3
VRQDTTAPNIYRAAWVAVTRSRWSLALFVIVLLAVAWWINRHER